MPDFRYVIYSKTASAQGVPANVGRTLEKVGLENDLCQNYCVVYDTIAKKIYPLVYAYETKEPTKEELEWPDREVSGPIDFDKVIYFEDMRGRMKRADIKTEILEKNLQEKETEILAVFETFSAENPRPDDPNKKGLLHNFKTLLFPGR